MIFKSRKDKRIAKEVMDKLTGEDKKYEKDKNKFWDLKNYIVDVEDAHSAKIKFKKYGCYSYENFTVTRSKFGSFENKIKRKIKKLTKKYNKENEQTKYIIDLTEKFRN
jgi:small-conductance mechanosensitive channel